MKFPGFINKAFKPPKHFFGMLYMGLLLFFAGCRGPVYEKYIDIGEETWRTEDSLQFNIDIKNPGKYALYINLSTRNDYAFANLWLSVNMKDPNGKSNKQRFNIHLYSPEGYPLQHDIGPVHFRKFPSARLEQRILPVDFIEPGNYTFTLKHEMRAPVLQGIVKIGLQLKPLR